MKIKKIGAWLEKYLCKMVFGFILLVIVVAIAGASYQKISTLVDERWRYPAPGELVEVDGHSMHINCTGVGGPTVILESGMGDSSLVWSWVQPEVAKFTRVCSYDRAGLGWSESKHGWWPFSATSRTIKQMAEELHTLLANKRVPGPYVLVGHSLGGMIARVYASTYPNEVAGMVLVDSTHEETYKRLPKAALYRADQQKRAHQEGLPDVVFGLQRLRENTDKYKWLPADVRRTYMSVQSRTQTHVTSDDEYLSFGESVKQAHSASRMPDNIPLFILFATGQFDNLLPGDREQTKQAWSELQGELASRSRNNVLRFVEGSDHSIHTNGRQGEVINAVHRVIEAAKNHSRLESN